MKTETKAHCIMAFFMLLLAGAYLGIAYYYMDGFSLGTWINGVYCTGKSVEIVNEELLAQTAVPNFEVIYPIYDGEELREAERLSSHFVLDGQMAKQDYTKALEKLLQKQMPLFWIQNLFFKAGGYELKPEVMLTDEGKEAFQKSFLADPAVQAEISRESCVKLKKDEKEGFLLYDGKKNRLDAQKALAECMKAIEAGKTSYILTKSCYVNEKISKEEKEIQALYQELQEFLDFTIIYDMGAEQVRFDKKALVDLLATEESEASALDKEDKNKESKESASTWKVDAGDFAFVRDKENKFCWDEEKVKAAIDKLADAYDTYGKPREFTMTSGGTVTLEKGNYGTELDRKTETKWLANALLERKNETHEPAYLRKAYARGENDIGDTYIEINMTKQKLWFYMDGKVEIETPIVTGDMMRKRATPEGVYYVYAMQKNRVLRGPGYAAHVNYWMPVKGGVGIHDALWRDAFGGDIYKKEGSHGCINLPFEAAEKLYGLVEIGVPTVMYYEE